MVDGLTDGPELRGGDHLALHQATGGLLAIGQRAFDGGALALRQGGQNLGALVVFQVLDDVGGVI